MKLNRFRIQKKSVFILPVCCCVTASLAASEFSRCFSRFENQWPSKWQLELPLPLFMLPSTHFGALQIDLANE